MFLVSVHEQKPITQNIIIKKYKKYKHQESHTEDVKGKLREDCVSNKLQREKQCLSILPFPTSVAL